MTDSLDLRDEEKLLECAICLNRLNDPRKLECRHAFCFVCIKSHYRTCGKRLAPCPICRKLYPSSLEANIDQLPQCSINFHQLLDTRNSRHQCESDTCENTYGPFLCLKCKKWLCFKCKAEGNKTRGRTHEAYRISDIDVRLYNIVVQSQNRFCVDHPGNEIQWFCRQCNILGCNRCKTRQPLHHTLLGVRQKAMELQQQFAQDCNSLQLKSEEHTKAQNFYHGMADKLSPLGICNTEACGVSAAGHGADAAECKGLVQIMEYLTNYASDEVLVSIYLNMEDQIVSELDKQPLNEIADAWLGEHADVLQSSGGNRRRLPKNDTDISKKINLTYYCNILAAFLFVAFGSLCVFGIGCVFYYHSEIWHALQQLIAVSAVDFIRNKMEKVLKEVFKPELVSQYKHIMDGFEADYLRFQNVSVLKWQEFFKWMKEEYCYKNQHTRLSNYGGNLQLEYKLDISTFCE